MRAESAERIANHFVQTLASTDGLNPFFEMALPLLAESLGATRSILIDYRKRPGKSDLLHFGGDPQQSRFELQRQILEMDVQRALFERKPYFSGSANRLYLPLYFTTTLEALLV